MRATLLWHRHPNGETTVTWEGPSWEAVQCSREMLRYGVLAHGVVVVGEDLLTDSFHLARYDGWRVFSALGWVLYFRWRILRGVAWRTIYRLACRTGRFHPLPGYVANWRHFWQGWRYRTPAEAEAAAAAEHQQRMRALSQQLATKD